MMVSHSWIRRSITLSVLGLVVVLASADPAHAVVVNGTSGEDTLFGSNAADIVSGEGDEDTLFGRRGKDVVDGGAGGTGGEADFLFGSASPDTLLGDTDQDVIFDDDSTAGDRVAGGSGEETVHAADGAKTHIDCGPGNDVVIADAIDAVHPSCETVISNNVTTIQFGTNGRNTLTGTDATDFLVAKGDNDRLFGGGSQDLLWGGGGIDRVFGEAGFDLLVDDDGVRGDVLDGGDGDDAIYAADGARGTIDCGEGAETLGDTVYADANDSVNNCENQNIAPA